MKILESYSAIANSLFIEADVDDKEMIKYKESTLNENPAAIAAVQAMVKLKMKNPKTGKDSSAVSALKNKDNPNHKKAKGIFAKLKDRFSKKKDDKKAAPKKQSQSDADFYKRQFAGESIMIDGKQYHPIKESKQHIFKEIYDRTFRSLK